MSALRSATIAVCLTTASLRPLGAQLASSIDLRASAARLGAATWTPSPALSSALRYDHPWLAAQADGAFGDASRGSWRASGAVSASVVTPSVAGVRAGFSGSLSRSPWSVTPDGQQRSASAGSARLSWRAGRNGMWTGVDVASEQGADSARAPRLAFGMWRQIGDAIVSVSMGSQTALLGGRPSSIRQTTRRDSTLVPDSIGGGPPVWRFFDNVVTTGDSGSQSARRRWSDVEGAVSWSRGRLALDGAVGARPALPGVRAATWARVESTVMLDTRFALVAGGGVSPQRPGLDVAARSFATLGMRVTRAPWTRRPMHPEVTPAAAGFNVRPAGPARYVLAVRVPRARTVELSGDFTSWKPVAMRKVAEHVWEAEFAMAPGTYRLNIRIDGERWTAPPGATTVPDEFNGNVGLIVVR